jgi:hypothetical protein
MKFWGRALGNDRIGATRRTSRRLEHRQLGAVSGHCRVDRQCEVEVPGVQRKWPAALQPNRYAAVIRRCRAALSCAREARVLAPYRAPLTSPVRRGEPEPEAAGPEAAAGPQRRPVAAAGLAAAGRSLRRAPRKPGRQPPPYYATASSGPIFWQRQTSVSSQV